MSCSPTYDAPKNIRWSKWGVSSWGDAAFAALTHKKHYGWIPHNAGFGFLDRPRGVLGVFASLDRF
jgi:hypothetical protein